MMKENLDQSTPQWPGMQAKSRVVLSRELSLFPLRKSCRTKIDIVEEKSSWILILFLRLHSQRKWLSINSHRTNLL
jgi:hypothetical protein